LVSNAYIAAPVLANPAITLESTKMAKRGKKYEGPKRTIVLRVPEEQYAELILLHPDLIDPVRSQIKYGAMNEYWLSLLMRDLEQRKRQAAAASPVVPYG
jgi:hypothetical protein